MTTPKITPTSCQNCGREKPKYTAVIFKDGCRIAMIFCDQWCAGEKQEQVKKEEGEGC